MDKFRRSDLLRIAAITFKGTQQRATLEELQEREELLQGLGIDLSQALREAEKLTLEEM
ncbi:MAG: hypothetical protein KBD47_01680 [Candidatus Pacebacteria bacterium]|nr:hypothetical protein [Candidatus Paceibacterota bacterium]